MQNNKNIQSTQVCYCIWKNSFYVEPATTVEATEHTTCILDAMKKQIYQKLWKKTALT